MKHIKIATHFEAARGQMTKRVVVEVQSILWDVIDRDQGNSDYTLYEEIETMIRDQITFGDL